MLKKGRIPSILDVYNRNTQKEKKNLNIKRSKKCKTFMEESEQVAIDQSQVILRKIYSISLQTTHSPQTCMHSFLTKAQCST